MARDRAVFYAKAEAPIVAEMRRAGLDVSSVWDLVNGATEYDHVLARLLAHLRLPYPPRVRDGIARAMAVPASAPMWPELVKLFAAERDQGVKMGLACAVAAAFVVTYEDDLVRVVLDRRHGFARNILIPALNSLPIGRRRRVLETLAEDEETSYEARRVLSQLKKQRG